jgi:hypothetical protein
MSGKMCIHMAIPRTPKDLPLTMNVVSFCSLRVSPGARIVSGWRNLSPGF